MIANEKSVQMMMKKVAPDPDTGCWLWQSSLGKGNYGRVSIASKYQYAHRVMYELFVGPIPDGLELDHLCRVHRCVNPDHLEPVTHLENCRRGIIGLNSAAKTHCPQGHPYDDENTYRCKGKRLCRECRRQWHTEAQRKIS